MKTLFLIGLLALSGCVSMKEYRRDQQFMLREIDKTNDELGHCIGALRYGLEQKKCDCFKMIDSMPIDPGLDPFYASTHTVLIFPSGFPEIIHRP